MNKEILQDALNNNTYDEVREKFNLSVRALNRLIKDNSLEVKYKRRTPISKTLIPIDEPICKLDKKKREAWNNDHLKLCKEDWWDKMISEYEEETENYKLRLGAILYDAAKLNNTINDLKCHIDRLSVCLDALKLGKLTNDYVGFVEEEQLYHSAETKSLLEYLDESVIFGYIAEKYGPLQAVAISEILKGDKNVHTNSERETVYDT